jgi:ABC-type nickel/cobalt efflux system permease component RcnA
MGQALVSTLMISIVPIFFIYGLNMACLSNSKTRDSVLFYLISFAIGGLLGDVFFHTLPHLSAPSGSDAAHHHHHDHDGSHSHSHDPKVMENNLIIVVGIVSFFLIEKMVQSYLGVSHEHSHSVDGKKELD